MARIRRDRAFWTQIQAAHQAGEGSYAALARRHEVPLSTLHLWMKRLDGAAAAPAKHPPRLVPVTLRPSEAPVFGLEVDAGGYRLRFAQGADPRYVAAVLHALAAP